MEPLSLPLEDESLLIFFEWERIGPPASRGEGDLPGDKSDLSRSGLSSSGWSDPARPPFDNRCF